MTVRRGILKVNVADPDKINFNPDLAPRFHKIRFSVMFRNKRSQAKVSTVYFSVGSV